MLWTRESEAIAPDQSLSNWQEKPLDTALNSYGFLTIDSCSMARHQGFPRISTSDQRKPCLRLVFVANDKKQIKCCSMLRKWNTGSRPHAITDSARQAVIQSRNDKSDSPTCRAGADRLAGDLSSWTAVWASKMAEW